MTFLFLDRVADIVGPPDALVAEARERIFRKPLRHEGLRRQPHDEIRAHVAGVVVRVANDRLREPLMAAVRAHAEEAGEAHAMVTGDESGSEGYHAAVVAAFAGNDVGIDMTAFAPGEATLEAVADQVLVVPKENAALDKILTLMEVKTRMLDAIVDEILAPVESVAWSLGELAETILQSAERGGAMCAASGGVHVSFATESLRYLLCESAPELRATGLQMFDLDVEDQAVNAWLDERAMVSSPEADEADVAEVLRLVNEKGGDQHRRSEEEIHSEGSTAEHMTSAGAEPDKPAPAAEPSKPQAPVAAEPSDVTRAAAGALKALFELTKESDTNVAKVVGVEKAVVAQSRKGITPWHPDPAQLSRLYALVGRYNDGLAAAAGALGALPGRCFAPEES